MADGAGEGGQARRKRKSLLNLFGSGNAGADSGSAVGEPGGSPAPISATSSLADLPTSLPGSAASLADPPGDPPPPYASLFAATDQPASSPGPANGAPTPGTAAALDSDGSAVSAEAVAPAASTAGLSERRKAPKGSKGISRRKSENALAVGNGAASVQNAADSVADRASASASTNVAAPAPGPTASASTASPSLSPVLAVDVVEGTASSGATPPRLKMSKRVTLGAIVGGSVDDMDGIQSSATNDAGSFGTMAAAADSLIGDGTRRKAGGSKSSTLPRKFKLADQRARTTASSDSAIAASFHSDPPTKDATGENGADPVRAPAGRVSKPKVGKKSSSTSVENDTAPGVARLTPALPAVDADATGARRPSLGASSSSSSSLSMPSLIEAQSAAPPVRTNATPARLEVSAPHAELASRSAASDSTSLGGSAGTMSLSDGASRPRPKKKTAVSPLRVVTSLETADPGPSSAPVRLVASSRFALPASPRTDPSSVTAADAAGPAERPASATANTATAAAAAATTSTRPPRLLTSSASASAISMLAGQSSLGSSKPSRPAVTSSVSAREDGAADSRSLGSQSEDSNTGANRRTDTGLLSPRIGRSSSKNEGLLLAGSTTIGTSTLSSSRASTPASLESPISEHNGSSSSDRAATPSSLTDARPATVGGRATLGRTGKKAGGSSTDLFGESATQGRPPPIGRMTSSASSSQLYLEESRVVAPATATVASAVKGSKVGITGTGPFLVRNGAGSASAAIPLSASMHHLSLDDPKGASTASTGDAAPSHPNSGVEDDPRVVHFLEDFQGCFLPLDDGLELDLSTVELAPHRTEFWRIRRLVTLRAPKQRLRLIPADVAQLSLLKELNLTGNLLTRLPAEIGQLVRLVTLDLSQNKLRHLPVQIGQLRRLQKLDLQGNQLMMLPADIGRLLEMRYLSVAHNQLLHLPPEVGHLSQLRALYVDSNQLSYLPTELGLLRHLEVLHAGGNRLGTVPSSLGKAIALAELNLRDNPITALPAALGKLPRLSTLVLNQCPLTYLPHQLRRFLTTDKLQTYWQSLEELTSTEVSTYRSKLMLVGYGSVGKSTLLHALFPFEAVVEKKRRNMLGWQTRRITIRGPFLETLDQPMGTATSQLALTRATVVKGEAVMSANGQVEKVLEDPEGRIWTVIPLKSARAHVFRCTSEAERMLLFRTASFYSSDAATVGVDVSTRLIPSKLMRMAVQEAGDGDSSLCRVPENGDPMLLSVLDFAGLESFQATHHLFLAREGVYVLLWDVTPGAAIRTISLAELRSWLVVLQLHLGSKRPGRSSPQDPIVYIVGNKADLLDPSETAEDFRLVVASIVDQVGLTLPFRIVDPISAQSPYQVAQLRQAILADLALQAHVGRAIPVCYIQIEQALARAASNPVPGGVSAAGGAGTSSTGALSSTAAAAGTSNSATLMATGSSSAHASSFGGSELERGSPAHSLDVDRRSPALIDLAELANQLKMPYEIVLRAGRLASPWGAFVPLKEAIPSTADVVAREPTWLSVDLLGQLVLAASHTNTSQYASKSNPPTPLMGTGPAGTLRRPSTISIADVAEAQTRFEDERRRLRCRLEHRRLLTLSAWQGMDVVTQDRLLRWLDELDVALPFRERDFAEQVARWRQGGTAEYAADEADESDGGVDGSGSGAAQKLPPPYVWATTDDVLFVPFALPKIPSRSSGFSWLPWTPFAREVTRVIRLNGVPGGFHGVLLAHLSRAVTATDYWKCWRNGFVLIDGDGYALVTVDDRAAELRICSRHQRRPAALADKLHSIAVMLIKRKYSGAHILYEGIECICSGCVKCKWGWDVTAISADRRRRTLYEKLSRENPMTAPHHAEISEQLQDLAGAHRRSTDVAMFDQPGLERARSAGDKSILCPLHRRQVNLVQLFGGETGPRRAAPVGSLAEAQAEVAEAACRQVESTNVFVDSLWLQPIPASAFVWTDERLLAYYETFIHLVTRVLVSATLVAPSDISAHDVAKAKLDDDESIVGSLLATRIGKAAGGTFYVFLMHRAFNKVSLKREADRLGRLRLTSDTSALPALVESVARTLTAARATVLLTAVPPGEYSDGNSALAMPSWGSVFGKVKPAALLNGLLLNGDVEPRVRRSQLFAVADAEALLDWLMSRSTPEARDELRRLPPNSDTLISRLVTAVTLSRPL